MGTLVYGNAIRTDFDDRLLAHLQSVIATKLRRNESFFVSWPKAPTVGGRTSIWIHPNLPLAFDYSFNDEHELSAEWLTALESSAGAEGGVRLTGHPSGSSLAAYGVDQTIFK
jgi:hypothetical protein